MTPRRALLALAAAALAAVASPLAAQPASPPSAPASAPQAKGDAVFPPWRRGQNNDAVRRGLEFTVPEIDVLADFHGDVTDPKLVLYVGGNYFFAMADLVQAFEAAHPEFKGRIYWETIPPGLLIEQMKAGGTVTSGNMTWTVRPDAYFAGLKKVQAEIAAGLLTGPAVPYATNVLTIMVPKGNPAGVRGLADLGRPGLKLVMPNPQFEGVARQIEQALEKAGGPALAHRVYADKVASGETLLTRIHHRQSPLFLMQGKAQAGVTWKSEAIFQEEVGNPISHVDIPADQNATGVYAGALVKGAAHPKAARLWLQFIRSPAAMKVFEHYGFKPYAGEGPAKGAR